MKAISEIFNRENVNWFVVLVIGTAGTALGTVLTNAVTVRRAHNKIRLWSEVWAGQQLTYFAFFPALIVAQKSLSESYKNCCFALIAVSILFFVFGLMNIRGHEQILAKDHSPCSGESCTTSLTPASKGQILRLNWILGLISLILSLALVFSLQYGKGNQKQQEGSETIRLLPVKALP